MTKCAIQCPLVGCAIAGLQYLHPVACMCMASTIKGSIADIVMQAYQCYALPPLVSLVLILMCYTGALHIMASLSGEDLMIRNLLVHLGTQIQ